MDHRKTCFCCCSCTYQTGTIFIATMYIVQPALTLMFVAATSVVMNGVLALFHISWFILIVLGLVLLCGADKRDPRLVATFYFGGWMLLALRVVFAVITFPTGEQGNFFGEAAAVALNVVLLSVVHMFMKEIKAEPMAEAAGDDGGSCCSLQTGVVFFGSTFIITSIPVAFGLVHALLWAPTTRSAEAVTVYMMLGFLFCTAYIVLGIWLLTGADRRSVSRTRAGLTGICILTAFQVVGLLPWTALYLLTSRGWEMVAMLEVGIVFVHICALVTVCRFMAQIRNGAADQAQAVVQMEDLNPGADGDQINQIV